MFYERGEDGLPRKWISRMKASMRTVSPMFSTTRMLKEYSDLLYTVAAERWQRLAENGFVAAKELSQWKRSLTKNWDKVAVEEVNANDAVELPVGGRVSVRAKVHLGKVTPDDVSVELYHGRVDPYGELVEGLSQPMQCKEHMENGTYLFDGEIPCMRSGQHGYAVRVMPKHADLVHRFDTGLIRWA